MRIGVISTSPSITTGFGVTTKYIIEGLARANHEIACFGIGEFGETFNRSDFPCKIWAVGDKNLISALNNFLSYEKVDAIIINFDIITVTRWFNICTSLGWHGPTIAYFVIDGLPIDPQYLNVLKDIDYKITATHSVAEYLQLNGFSDVLVAPHGVDNSIFAPSEDKRSLKKEAGVDNKFIIGCFGRNNERKQQPRVLKALSLLEEAGKASDIILYLHCQPEDNPKLRGWNLKWLAQELGIADKVFFPSHNFKQVNGVPFSSNQPSDEDNTQRIGFLDGLGYVDRINCCDLIINVPFCGGFELSIIEAQACGVPVAVTNDKSILDEVAGKSAILLSTSNIGTWYTGANQFFVSPETIADAIIRIKTDHNLREKLISQGLKNVERFDWNILQDKIVQVVDNIFTLQ